MRVRFASAVVVSLWTSGSLAQVPPAPPAGTDRAVPRPRLFVGQRIIDLGKVVEGDKVTAVWRLENQGTADLVIDNTRASCGCTVVQLAESDKVIPPGETLALKAEFDSRGRKGVQQKSVSVYSNDAANPVLTLDLRAEVEALYDISPANILNLGSVRRGEISPRKIDLLPGPGHGELRLLGLDFPEGSPLLLTHEAFDSDGRTGERISIAVSDTASPGPIDVSLTIRLRVGELERERTLPIRGQVIGALTWQPQVVDATRVPSPWGKRFAPVAIRSTDSVPFEILESHAGPLLTVTVPSAEHQPRSAQHTIVLSLREGAPPGPFAATLEVRTNLLDQPLIRVPIFGIVAEPVRIEPPMILLRADGTPVGRKRRVKLQSLPQQALEVSAATCDRSEVSVSVARAERAALPHVAFVDVELTGACPSGRHRGMVTVMTNVTGAERLEIPLILDVPDERG